MANSSDWIQHKEARDFVLKLLEESGALLESRVSTVCDEFASTRTKTKGVRVSSESLTYGLDTEESPLRQIDERVSLYKEFVLDERTGVQFHIQIPVEAKHRKDLQIIGVPLHKKSYPPRMPLTGFLQGTRLANRIAGAEPLPSLPLLNPVPIEIRDGKTPQREKAENLLYKAAAALYDFIRFDMRANTEDDSDDIEIVSSMNLLSRFEQYLKEKHYVWWSVIHRWMDENLSTALATEFNKRYLSHRVYFGLDYYIPVCCCDAPIWELHTDTSEFRSVTAILTRVRPPNWPGSSRQVLIRYTAEAPLVITNLQGLPLILDACFDGFLEIERRLKKTDETTLSRWPLESAFYKAAVRHFLGKSPDTTVRSDLDVFYFLNYL